MMRSTSDAAFDPGHKPQKLIDGDACLSQIETFCRYCGAANGTAETVARRRAGDGEPIGGSAAALFDPDSHRRHVDHGRLTIRLHEHIAVAIDEQRIDLPLRLVGPALRKHDGPAREFRGSAVSR